MGLVIIDNYETNLGERLGDFYSDVNIEKRLYYWYLMEGVQYV